MDHNRSLFFPHDFLVDVAYTYPFVVLVNSGLKGCGTVEHNINRAINDSAVDLLTAIGIRLLYRLTGGWELPGLANSGHQ